jgi:predicted small secreted protein
MTRTTAPAPRTLVALLLAGLLKGFKTTTGVSKDISAVGDTVTGSAQEHKGY